MVENQCGSRDIAQSTDEKVMVRPISSSPPPERPRSRRATRSW